MSYPEIADQTAAYALRIMELEEALCTAATMVRDLANGWSVRELHCTPWHLRSMVERLCPRQAQEIYTATGGPRRRVR